MDVPCCTSTQERSRGDAFVICRETKGVQSSWQEDLLCHNNSKFSVKMVGVSRKWLSWESATVIKYFSLPICHLQLRILNLDLVRQKRYSRTGWSYEDLDEDDLPGSY